MRARSEIDSIAESTLTDSGTDHSDISITVVAGGNDRIESVQLALKSAGAADVVLVHDAARALTPPEVFRRVVAAVRAGAEAVVPVLPMTDTVRRAETRPAVKSDRGTAVNDGPSAPNRGQRQTVGNLWSNPVPRATRSYRLLRSSTAILIVRACAGSKRRRVSLQAPCAVHMTNTKRISPPRGPGLSPRPMMRDSSSASASMSLLLTETKRP